MVLLERYSHHYESLFLQLPPPTLSDMPPPACQPLPCQVSGLHYNTSNIRSRRGYMAGLVRWPPPEHCTGTVFSFMPLLGQFWMGIAIHVSVYTQCQSKDVCGLLF